MFEKFWTPNGTAIVPRYLASLDVLGFKNRLANQGLSGVFADYGALQVHLKGLGTKFTVLGTLFNQTVGVTKQAPYVLLSDTLLLWCDADGDVESFIAVCGGLVADSVRRGMFLRGAVAFGETIIDPSTNTFLGQPIVDAYLAETDQEWVGLALHPTAVRGLGGVEGVIPYDVPTKGGLKLERAVTWHHYMLPQDAIDGLERGKANSGGNGQKYDNAIQFVRQHPL